MPYGYVVLSATVLLAVRHVRSNDASRRSKYIVVTLAAASVLAPYLWPSSLPLAGLVTLGCMLLQFALCFYVLFHQVIWPPDEEQSMGPLPLERTFPSERPGGGDK